MLHLTLAVMDSIDPECTKLKQKYEACFYSWYSEKYLTGKSREDECAPLFKEYRQCLEVVDTEGFMFYQVFS